MKRSAQVLRPVLGRATLTCLVLLAATAADARVLCSNPQGRVRLREACRRTETTVDVSDLASPAGGLPPPAPTTPGAPDSTRIPLAPCRLIDTRPGTSSRVAGDDIGPLAAGELRTYSARGACDIPADATGLSINLAVVPGAQSGFASVGPSGSVTTPPAAPSFASINYRGGSAPISNSMIVDLDPQGRVDVYAASPADVIVDVSGYFLPQNVRARDVFVPAGSDSRTNGDALSAIVNQLNARADLEPVVVRLGAGTYWLNGTLHLNRNMSLVGAGRSLTVVVTTAGTETIRITSPGVEIRDLYVVGQSLGQSSVPAIYFTSSAVNGTVRNVRAFSAGIGIEVWLATVELEDVWVEAADRALRLAGGHANVRGSRLASTRHHVVTARASSTVRIEHSTLTASDSWRSAIDLGNGGAAAISHSRLALSGAAYAVGAAGTLSMTHTTVEGASGHAVPGAPSCAATVVNGVFYPTTCP